MSVTISQMRSKLHELDHIVGVLGQSEPMESFPFTVGKNVRFRAEPGWNHSVKAASGSDPLGVFVTLGSRATEREFTLTKDALHAVTHATGWTNNYADVCPAELLVPHLNYWYREGLYGKGSSKTDFQFLVSDTSVAVAFAKQTMKPFSNLSLVDTITTGIRKKFGDVEILADYKFSHSFDRTDLRLVIPNASRVIEHTGTDDDLWSLGIQLRNSLTGSKQTSLDGYLFRWVCTNGQIDARATSGTFTRRKDATDAEVAAWAAQSVDEVLGGLEPALDAVQGLTSLHVEGSLADTLRDVFEHYHIPIGQRSKIIKLLGEYPGEVTMYVIMNAITQVANESGLDAHTVDSLMRVGGDFPYSADKRCGACRRLMHEH